MSLKSKADLEYIFVIFDLNPFYPSLSSWLFGDEPDSMSLCPENSVTIALWISEITQSLMAELIALLIGTCRLFMSESFMSISLDRLVPLLAFLLKKVFLGKEVKIYISKLVWQTNDWESSVSFKNTKSKNSNNQYVILLKQQAT